MIRAHIADTVLRVSGLPRDYICDGRLSGLVASLEDAAMQGGMRLVLIHDAATSALPYGAPIPVADLPNVLGIEAQELEDVLSTGLRVVDADEGQVVARGDLRAWALR